MKIITFISTFEMYDKEELGIKPNTIRILGNVKAKKLLEATHVQIRRAYTKKAFIRRITDKTFWNGEWIISWDPNKILLNFKHEKGLTKGKFW